MKTTSKWRPPPYEDELKYKDNLKYEDNLLYEGGSRRKVQAEKKFESPKSRTIFLSNFSFLTCSVN